MPEARGRDFGDVFDFSTMTDDEIYDVVLEHLKEYPELDMGWLEVQVRDGRVTLTGRVGTDAELQVAEKALVEVLGITDVVNELVVDELHRNTLPEAIDDSLAEEYQGDDELGTEPQQSDTAAHLSVDLEAQTYGTDDPQAAIEEGTAYNPPDRVTPGGYDSNEQH
ncbi:MAG TPA: BON domain-containing protein [Longimicrobiaceae bacterium]|nr:BON domain-containing protein [Longimicrobiaceae bacterium]